MLTSPFLPNTTELPPKRLEALLEENKATRSSFSGGFADIVVVKQLAIKIIHASPEQLTQRQEDPNRGEALVFGIPPNKYLLELYELQVITPSKSLYITHSSEIPPSPYFVTATLSSFAAHRDLFSFMNDQRRRGDFVDPLVVAQAAYQVQNALQHLHKHQILHRDVKPENMFIFDITAQNNLHVKLGDFGLARNFQEAAEQMAIEGSPSYTAPELLRKETQPKSDLSNYSNQGQQDWYALGVALFVIMTADFPFTDTDSDSSTTKTTSGSSAETDDGLKIVEKARNFTDAQIRQKEEGKTTTTITEVRRSVIPEHYFNSPEILFSSLLAILDQLITHENLRTQKALDSLSNELHLS